VPLGAAQERELGEAQVRALGKRLQHPPEALRQALDCRPVEQVPVVLDRQRQTASGPPDVERQVELGGAGRELQLLRRQPRQRHRRLRGVLERQHHLEQGRPRQLPPGGQLLHQAVEGQLLMRQGVEDGLARPGHQVAQRRPARQVPPKHQGVDEEPDQSLAPGPRPVRHRRADRHVVLPARAAEKGLEAGDQDHEKRRVLAPRPALEGRRERVVEEPAHHAAPPARRRRARPVRRQLRPAQAAQAGQVLAPIRQPGFESLAHEPSSLPGRVVAVLIGQRLEARRPSRAQETVRRAHLPDQEAHGPPVRDDMVQARQEHVVVRPAANRQRPQERSPPEVEGAPGRVHRQCLRGPAPRRLGQPGQIDPRQAKARRGLNHLDRLLRPWPNHRTQSLVTPHDHREGPGQGPEVEGSREPVRPGEDIGGVSGPQLVQEPEALLGERQWDAPAAL
jgi:hypothetical protein